MTITQHPTDETLAQFAAGHLDDGRSRVIAAHVGMCPECRRWEARLRTLGGMLLADADPTALSGRALEDTLARLTTDVLPTRRAHQPPSMQNHTEGKWKWMGPGVRWQPVSAPDDGSARVFLLKAAPGTRMPHHTHTGTELTLVLSGAFSHVGGRYGPGDLDEADGSIEHQPIVEKGEDCICLVAMEGKLQLLGLVGRVLQPFVRL
jgi:putative transcriptional regulator